MRHLSPRRAQRGMTLIELMIAIVIVGVLVVAAAPFFGDYVRNSRLRESGNMLFTEALMVQSEAIKRNTTIRLTTTASLVRTTDETDPLAPVVLRERTPAEGVVLAAATIAFGGQGRPTPFGNTASIDLSYSAVTCTTETRCPGLRIDAGGAVRLCSDHTSTCP